MILVDTSVWIDWLRGTTTEAVQRLERILEGGIPFGITGVIYQEILQGADSAASLQRLADYFGSQRFYSPLDTLTTHKGAAELYQACRNQGITIRSTIDCLIAQIALEHELMLLHSDRDFDRLREAAPRLQFLDALP